MTGTISQPEAARRLGISVRTLQRRADAGEVTRTRAANGRPVYDEAEVAHMAAAAPGEGAAAGRELRAAPEHQHHQGNRPAGNLP